MKNTNWKVTVRSINQIAARIFESDLSYNEARKMAKEYNDAQNIYIYRAERA